MIGKKGKKTKQTKTQPERLKTTKEQGYQTAEPK